MATEIEADNIQYVEYLDAEEYDENQEVVTVDEESLQQVEFIEAEQISGDIEYDGNGIPRLEGHTIFEHNGKQYMIPNELHQAGHTIVLEDYETEGITLVDNEQEQKFMLPVEEETQEEIAEETSEEVSEITYTYAEDCSENSVISPTSPTECYMIYNEQDDEQEGTVEATTEVDTDGDTQVIQAVSENAYIMSAGAETTLGKQYAVLRDGRLHIEGVDSDGAQGLQTEELEGKLQVLEDSLTYKDDETMEITGKNLITGQTISLNGFLEKLKKKSDFINVKREPADNSFYPPNVKRQRRSYYNHAKNDQAARFGLQPPKPNYILMPPVNRKVLVGKTPEGKNIVGRILQIWKKVDPNAPPPKPRTMRRKPQPKITKPEEKSEKNEQIEELIIDNTGKILEVKKNEPEKATPKNVLLKKKYVSKAFLDQNIVKTLSGLMELESIQKNLALKNLIIKHILKKSVDGKVLPGREVTYYYGHMEKSDVVDCFNEVKTQWTFVSDYRENLDDRANGIDLNESSDRQQVDLVANEKVTFGSLTEPELPDTVCSQSEADRSKRSEFNETVPVNLIVIEDEYGKKRTKVTIPQLGGTPKCQVCHKMFRTETHLRRHMMQHSETGNFTCEHCGKTFYDINALFRHSKTHVNSSGGAVVMGGSVGSVAAGDREYVCYVCDKAFTSPGSLKRHITVHDHSLRPLQCMVCMNRFTDESSLKKHMVLHTGIKPFQCETCLKCFVHAGDLNFHRKIHDPLKRYQCQVCGKEFNRHSNMLRHADIHRGSNGEKEQCAYKCDMCGCQYNFISSLTRHIVNKHMQGQSSDGVHELPPDSVGEQPLILVQTVDEPEKADMSEESTAEQAT